MRIIIELFDKYLAKCGLRFQAVIIDGAALNVMDLISSLTKDIDCIALSPSSQELDQCLAWLYKRDGNSYWPDNVRLSLQKLAKELGYDYHPAN